MARGVRASRTARVPQRRPSRAPGCSDSCPEVRAPRSRRPPIPNAERRPSCRGPRTRCPAPRPQTTRSPSGTRRATTRPAHQQGREAAWASQRHAHAGSRAPHPQRGLYSHTGFLCDRCRWSRSSRCRNRPKRYPLSPLVEVERRATGRDATPRSHCDDPVTQPPWTCPRISTMPRGARSTTRSRPRTPPW